MTDKCGAELSDGGKCSFQVKYPDGRCGHHTDCDEPIEQENDGPGRPTKLTKERQERIATAIEEGVPLVAACRLNGIVYKSHERWMERGEEQDEGIFAEYCQRVTRALGHDQNEKTQEMLEAANKQNDTGTMLTVLKQRYPETWGDTDISEASSVKLEVSERVTDSWPTRE